MKGRWAAFVMLLTCLSWAGAAAQMTLSQAKEEGKSLGQAFKADPSHVPTDPSQASAVPGYTGTTQPQSAYFDDPDALVAAGGAQAGTNDAYNVVTDPLHQRPTFDPQDIKATAARATAIEKDPSTYLHGEDMGGSHGSCTPLPRAAGPPTTYQASCNVGSAVVESSGSCSVQKVPVTQALPPRYYYYGVPDQYIAQGFASHNYLMYKTEASICAPTGLTKPICDAMIDLGAGGTDPASWLASCRKRFNATATEFMCNTELPQSELGMHYNFKGGTVYLKLEMPTVTVLGTSSTCGAFETNADCQMTSEVCTDPGGTRTLNGVSFTEPCWGWQRDYVCKSVTTGNNNCSSIDKNKQCKYARTECLDDPQTGPCKTQERIYSCTGSAPAGNQPPQYICGKDVYCLNGDCETIDREASQDLKDALVGLHAIDDAQAGLDPSQLTVFSGERDTCHKPVFGAINCCAGKSSGTLTVAAGAAALSGGPGAIAALATPFLTTFACSQDEMKLDIKDRMGFCHEVGTYCSSSFLGVCESKKKVYCCFESKLARILQEQGRVQLGKPWDSPKKEQCKGFTIEEFASLDLSKMDFTEVYADFVDAVKLPDEAQAMSDIQKKIQDYYATHGQ